MANLVSTHAKKLLLVPSYEWRSYCGRPDGWLLALLVLTTLRVLPFLIHAGLHFDSDQAVFGLMAIDLSRLRALPIVMYGQEYLLGVIAWLAAPLFAGFGPSIWLLKLPLAGINLLTAGLLWKLLRVEVGLSSFGAALLAALFAVPTVVAGSGFINASGGHVDPLLYALIFYLLRRRPTALGVFAGFALCHRELTVSALAAVLVINFWERSSLRRYGLDTLRVLLGCGALMFFIRLFAANYSTNYHEIMLPIKLTAAPLNNLVGAGNHLNALLGLMRSDLKDTGAPISLLEGHVFARYLLIILTVLLLPGLVYSWRQRVFCPPWRQSANRFPIYLVLTSLSAICAYALKDQQYDAMLLRYLYFVVYLPIGLAAWLWANGTAYLRVVALGAGLALLSMNLVTNSLYAYHLSADQPVDRMGEVASFLRTTGLKVGAAPYWINYNLTFRLKEKIIVATTDFSRIPEYQAKYEQDPSAGFTVQNTPCRDLPSVLVAGYTICLPKRAAALRGPLPYD